MQAHVSEARSEVSDHTIPKVLDVAQLRPSAEEFALARKLLAQIHEDPSAAYWRMPRHGFLGHQPTAHLHSEHSLTKAALGQLRGAHMTRALEFGAKVAAVTVARAGANPPWHHEISDA